MNNNIIQKSIGWSLFSEIAVKFVVPITNMILTRILNPDAFGVVAICNMLISFIDLISDAGFGKYLVQADFIDENDKNEHINVAFWTNLMISALMVSFICFFRIDMANLLGNGQYANVISVSSIQILITSVSSIQMAILRRKCNFEKLFIARISVAVFPLLITVPIAIIMKSFWALIIGNIFTAAFNAIILSFLTKWKPRLFYSFDILKNMFSYSFWSLCEALANWTIFWIDTFIVGKFFTEYQLGLYKNSAFMVQSIMGMLSAGIGPVLLSILSKIKHIDEKFNETFINIQNLVLYLALPMGLGILIYRETITLILFGSKWTEASNIVGAWAVMMMLSVIFYSMPAELYKSKGIPKILFVFQLIYLVVLIPVCYISAGYGFWTMVYVRCICILWQVIVSLLFITKFFKIDILGYFKTFIMPALITGVMVIFSVLYRLVFKSVITDVFGILISIIIYFLCINFFAKKTLLNILHLLKNKDKDITIG